MSAEPYAILASNSTSLEFSGGVLTKGEAAIDTGAIPKAALAALGAQTIELPCGPTMNELIERRVLPHLQRLWDDDGWTTCEGDCGVCPPVCPNGASASRAGLVASTRQVAPSPRANTRCGTPSSPFRLQST
mgnify:CR=1 FL=1